MKNSRNTLMITSVLFMAAIWGFIAIEKGTNLFKGLDLLIFLLIIGLGIIAMVNALKKDREEKEGLPPEDELSNQIKYKAGYYAYLSSMYLWLIIFLMKDHFPDIETMLGGGILISALFSFLAKVYVQRNLYAK